MDTYKLKFTRLQNEIFRLLCIKAGKSLNQREIARILRVSPTAVAKAVKLLEKESMIKIEKSKTMNLTLIQLNREKAIALKRIENLKQIYESGFAEFLSEKFPGSTIVLFGSYSLGEDTTASDIDIAIIGSKEKKIDLTNYDKLFERTVFLHFYNDLRKINGNLRENIINGITL